MGKVVDLEAGKQRRTAAAKGKRRAKSSKTALVLGGGGFTGGVYEIGALRAIDLLSVNRSVNQLDVYVGTSAGAFVASMAANGITPEEFKEWGGEWLPHEYPRVCIPQVTNGVANAVFNEAIMLTLWGDWARREPLAFIPIEPDAMQRLVSEYGLRAATVETGRVLNERAVPCLDWSHWATVVRDDMLDDVAYEITSVMVEERAELEGRFRHIPAQHSPLSYPIEPREMARGVDLPLHPGAQRYYREHGLE
jgi:hypothetical protein